MTNSAPHTRSLAIWKLADFGTNARVAVPGLRLASTDTNPGVSDAASKALLEIAPESSPTLFPIDAAPPPLPSVESVPLVEEGFSYWPEDIQPTGKDN